MSLPVIKTQRTVLSLLDQSNAEILLRYYLDNRDHLLPWEPSRLESYFTYHNFESKITENHSLFTLGSAVNFSATNCSGTEIIGVCNFSNIVHGAFQACNLGYSIAEKYQGQGYMNEILTAGLDYIFKVVDLHRVMANYLPHNKRSANLLEALGFEKEGTARSYLKIAGKWQDHILTAKLNPNHSYL